MVTWVDSVLQCDFVMTRTAPLRRRLMAFLVTAVLWAGLPGLVHAACPACQASQRTGSQLHAACCEQSAWKPASCCARPAAGALGVATRDLTVPAPASTCAPLAVVRRSAAKDGAVPPRASHGPPLHEGVALHVLHSSLLI
jgi:hypothetical protein